MYVMNVASTTPDKHISLSTFSADKETMVIETGNMKVTDILSQFNKRHEEKELK